MYHKKKFPLFTSLLAFSALIISGCANTDVLSDSRTEAAQNIAQQGGLTRQDLETPRFTIASWQRLNHPSPDIHVYIEGDGLAWLDRRTPSLNPTPKNPVALGLAATDTLSNIVYLARPCQYVRLDEPQKKCGDEYWRGKRFAPEIITAYQSVLDAIKAQRLEEGIDTRFHLIGYSGGANIAGILAAQRHDIHSIRSVAGNVDNDFFTQYHDVSPMPESLNMADYNVNLKSTPQLHFVANDDDTIPLEIYKSYEGKLNQQDSICSHYKIIDNTTHTKGWEAVWPDLLQISVRCVFKEF